MSVSSIFSEAWQALKFNRQRSLLTTVSLAWGVACFVSIAVRRPLIGVLAGAWYPFPNWFRASDAFRREFSVQSAVFGVFYVARAALRLWALLATGVGGFVVVSIVTGSPFVLVLIAWGVWHARRTFSAL